MDKIKKFLEAYVQWLAVLLGVGFLGWMIYSYVLLKPVSVSVGSESAATPGEVDHLIMDGPGQTLKGKMESTAPPPPMGPQENLPAKFVESLSFVSPSVVAVQSVPYTQLPVPLDQDDFKGPAQHEGLVKKITKLPDAPALADIQISGGHSNVPGPVAAVPVGGAAPVAANQVAIDKNWRTVEGTLRTADLAKSFAAAGIVPGSAFSDTTILRVVLLRQERNVDGTWPKDDSYTEIAPLDINPLPPLPPVDANFADQQQYGQDFAQKNVALIAQPPFYQVLQGDTWYEPGTKNPNQVDEVEDTTFDPLNPGAYTGDPTKLLPAERKAYDDAKAKKAAQDARRQGNQNRGNNTPPPPPAGDIDSPGNGSPGGGGGNGGGGGRRGGRGSGLAADPQRGQNGGELPPPAAAPDNPPPAFGQPGGAPAFGQPAQPGMPGSQPGSATLPAGSFDPSQQGDIKMWAHDVTVQAGKTYRYKLRYYIANPVARSNGLCANPADAKKFWIQSPDSAWTDPISVEADTNFFAVEQKHGIHFDVFKWKNGLWQMQSVTANPGDMVGTVDTTTPARTDFTTGWTLVDVREEPNGGENDRKLILVSDNGTVIIKELATDQHSSKYRELYNLVNKDKTNPVAAGSPQLPPPIN